MSTYDLLRGVVVVTCLDIHDFIYSMLIKIILQNGPFRGSNPGPLAPRERIIPLDQTTLLKSLSITYNEYAVHFFTLEQRIKFHQTY